MHILTRLEDIYRFPGFRAKPELCGIFGDPNAVVVTLTRRRKKLHAASAVRGTRVTTISGGGGFGISPAVTGGSTSRWKCAGFPVVTAAL